MQLPLAGPIDAHTAEQLAIAQGQTWLEDSIATLWPGAPPVGGWWQTGGVGLGRYDNANTDVSELYLQTPAGNNVSSRFSSSQPAGSSNLYVVGDWTKARFSGGCSVPTRTWPAAPTMP